MRPQMAAGEDKTLLIVEDDRPLRERLARAMEARGFTVAIAESVAEGKTRAKEAPPADADDILAALMAQPGSKPKPPENPMSADRVRWEHIQRVYELCGHNVSETARRLNMHRRTLQ